MDGARLAKIAGDILQKPTARCAGDEDYIHFDAVDEVAIRCFVAGLAVEDMVKFRGAR